MDLQRDYVFVSTMCNIFQTPTSVEISCFFTITNLTLQWNESLDDFKKSTQLLSQECPICASMGVLISRITRCGMTWKRFAYYQTFVIYGESINDMDFPQKGPMMQRLHIVFDVILISFCTNGRVSGDLRPHDPRLWSPESVPSCFDCK